MSALAKGQLAALAGSRPTQRQQQQRHLLQCQENAQPVALMHDFFSPGSPDWPLNTEPLSLIGQHNPRHKEEGFCKILRSFSRGGPGSGRISKGAAQTACCQIACLWVPRQLLPRQPVQNTTQEPPAQAPKRQPRHEARPKAAGDLQLPMLAGKTPGAGLSAGYLLAELPEQ